MRALSPTQASALFTCDILVEVKDLYRRRVHREEILHFVQDDEMKRGSPLGMINKTEKLDVHGFNRLQRTGTLPTPAPPTVPDAAGGRGEKSDVA